MSLIQVSISIQLSKLMPSPMLLALTANTVLFVEVSLSIELRHVMASPLLSPRTAQ